MSIPVFEDLCRKYVEQHGKGSLIPPISQDNSRDCEIFKVVEKRKKKLIYKTQIEYAVMDLKIFDLLDESLQLEDPCLECKEVEAGEWVFISEHEHSLSFVTRWAKNLLGLFKSSSHTHSTNVNVVAVDIKKKNDFMKMLNNRKIKLGEQFIKDRKDDNSVMCVISGVRKTKNVVEIKRTHGQSGSMSSDKKDSEVKINANISDKTMTWSRLPKNTTLAYTVLELKIDLISGAIESRWNSIDGAGFFYAKQNTDMNTIEVPLHQGVRATTIAKIESSELGCKIAGTPLLIKQRIIQHVQCEEWNINNFDVPNLWLHSNPDVESQPSQEGQKEQNTFLQRVEARQDYEIRHKPEPLQHIQDELEPSQYMQDQLEHSQHMQDQLEPSQHMQDQLNPFHFMQIKLEPLRRHLQGNTIKSSFLQLITCRNDLALLSKMLDKAERGQLREQKKRYQQSANKDALFTIFNLAGFEIETDDIVYERKPKEILKAVAYIVGIMCDVDEKYLVKISQCSEKQLKALEKIFRTVISSKMTAGVTIDNEIKPALEKPAKDILTDMDFGLRFYSWTILPPKTHTEVHECIYCILYCFS